MTSSIQDVEEAIARHRADPAAFGPMVAALRSARAIGARSLADRTARTYAARFGGDGRAAELLLALAGAGPVRTWEHGEEIIREGEGSDSAFVLLRGQAAVWRVGAGQLATLGPGDCFGEIALLGGTKRTATVLARGAAVTVEVPRDAVGRLAQGCPGLTEPLREAYRVRLLGQMFPPGSCFSELPVHQREKLFEHFVPCSVRSGTRVLREAQPAVGFCVIVSGRATVWRQGVNRQRQVLAELRPGEFFGEISLLYEVPVTANVEADGPLTFFALRQADFRAFLRDNPRAGTRLYRVARRRLGYGDTNHGISAEHSLVPGPVPVVATAFGGQTCPDCGYPDAGITCVACGRGP